MTVPCLQLTGIAKTYHAEAGSVVPALAGLGLTVSEGEFVCLIGSTGCGKTTLLNIIAGLDVPDTGEVRLGEGLRQGFNMPCVFQHYTLFPWRSLLGNVTFGLEMRGTPRSERRSMAVDLLAKVGLQGFANAYPHELSGGMRQRAAIAQALAIQPRLLLMDEPFGAVDDRTRAELQAMLSGLWSERRITIVFVTHNIDEAITMGDRVAVLSGRPGRIIEEFPITLPRPRNSADAGFTGLFVQIRRLLSTAAAD